MSTKQLGSRGFTLIAALMLLVLLSGISLGLLYMVNTETRVGSGDLENSLAFHAAEGGMEQMTADLANLFSNQQAPTPGNITALQNRPPAIAGITYPDYKIVFKTNADGTFFSEVRTISSGPNAGLMAQIVPMTLSVTAKRPLGDQVRMYRTVEVALIPVFQFGVFSDSDLSYFPGPVFDFAGRIHTNGNLFLADGNKLTFHSKVSAVGEVVRSQLANGHLTSDGYTGYVYIPKSANGCDPPAPNCRDLTEAEGSIDKIPGGIPYPGWTTLSTGTYSSFVTNGLTGAVPLTLPFVGGGATPVQIIRRPAPNEAAGSTVGASRLYNQAQVRVLLSDVWQENHAENPPVQDADDFLLNNAAYSVGGVVTSFAQANTDCTNQPALPCEPVDFRAPFGSPGSTKQWPLVDGWLRVEIKKVDGTWMPVTREWLGFGFARDVMPPNAANSHANAVHPSAILILQQQADRNGDGVVGNGKVANGPPAIYESTAITGANSQYNWFPINFYDPREGEVRDVASATCAPNGVMNAVELDVLNLRKWLKGTFAGNGNQTDWKQQNGYVLYYSDRRGMRLDQDAIPAPTKTGEYGFEDVINSADSAGVPNGLLEASEDVDGSAQLDNWGAANVGTGFGVSTGTNPYIPRQTCTTVARKNWVSGARHVLRLVNGSRGNVPTRLPDELGGFTVASENPVYVLGDYNAKTSENAYAEPHSAAAVIADAVTLLSNKWSAGISGLPGDLNSFKFPTTPGSRPGDETRYRLAIAAGKNINFAEPKTWSASKDFGTDGGVHNFLRYIENWGAPLHYQGSLVSLYYSQYATGIFKCCTTTYSPPTRDYSFDVLFLDPQKLPPGTPMFRDVNNTSYRQDFTPAP